MLSDSVEFKIELTEEEPEKDVEEKEESKLLEMDKFFDSFLNDPSAAADEISKIYFQQFTNYCGFVNKVQVPPPEFS